MMAREPCRWPQRVALLAEGVGRNCWSPRSGVAVTPSPSSRRAWVEIFIPRPIGLLLHVALLAEGVGRNQPSGVPVVVPNGVALLAEGVGRNHTDTRRGGRLVGVALLAEGVGRNLQP